jgi:CDP-diacylglycerol---serine O-phosphatidyltransferase
LIKHFLNPPNWFTAASIFCTTYAMTLMVGPGEVTPEILSRACVLVIFGGVFDLLDGRVARMTKRFTEFGVQLDTIADVLGFGIAPALLAWSWTLHELGPLGVAVVVWYVIAAAFRLARFNVNTSETRWPLRGHSQGLTTTMAGGALVTFVWVMTDYMAAMRQPPALVVAVVVSILGLLMVSSVPFRNFRDLRRNRNARRLAAFGLGACLTGAVVLDPSMWWGIGALLYLTAGLGDALVVVLHQRHLTKRLEMDEIFEEFATSGDFKVPEPDSEESYF